MMLLDMSQWRKYTRHPLSEAWPDMSEVEFESIHYDMKQHGYDNKQQVWIYEGKILDGWHRMRAAILANVTPTFDTFKGSEEEAQIFVIRRNLSRRHLDASQRGLIAGRLAVLKHGGNRKSKDQDANLHLDPPHKTLEKVAADLHVSRRTAADGKVVAEEGTKQLQEAVMDKVVSVSDAAAVATEPAATQNAAVKAVRKRTARTAKAAVATQAVAVEEAKPEPMMDALDHPIPDVLAEVFSKVSDFKAIVAQLNAINRKLLELKDHKAGACMRVQQAQVDLKNLKETVRFDTPYAVCPVCKGIEDTRKQNCPCKQRGWLVETAYKNLPQEYRQ